MYVDFTTVSQHHKLPSVEWQPCSMHATTCLVCARQARLVPLAGTGGACKGCLSLSSTGQLIYCFFCCQLLRVPHREELASLNRSIQSTAKGIKTQLEALSRDRAALPEPQQAKLRKLMQDFAAALQVRHHCSYCVFNMAAAFTFEQGRQCDRLLGTPRRSCVGAVRPRVPARPERRWHVWVQICSAPHGLRQIGKARQSSSALQAAVTGTAQCLYAVVVHMPWLSCCRITRPRRK
jgi:hypothetical protein